MHKPHVTKKATPQTKRNFVTHKKSIYNIKNRKKKKQQAFIFIHSGGFAVSGPEGGVLSGKFHSETFLHLRSGLAEHQPFIPQRNMAMWILCMSLGTRDFCKDVRRVFTWQFLWMLRIVCVFQKFLSKGDW